MDLTVVLPAMNEEEALPGVIEGVLASFDRHGIDGEVLVIDDGSEDGTPRLLEALAGPRVRSERFPCNRGRAHALARGMAGARGRGIALMDSDGQYDADDLPALLAALDGGADLVNGVRTDRADDARRRMVSRTYNLMVMRLVLGVRVADANSGLKVVRRSAVPALGFDPEGFRRGHRYLVAWAVRRGLVVAEVPVRHHDRTGGRSYIRPLREARHTLRDLVAFRRRMASAPPPLPADAGPVTTAR